MSRQKRCVGPAAAQSSSRGWFVAHLGDLVAAWRTPAVLRGLAGTVLITLGALSPAYQPDKSPLRILVGTSTWAKLGGTVVTVAGLLLLVDAWFRLRPRVGEDTPQAYRHLKHWAVLSTWSVPFLPAPPIFSQDAYSYAAHGWLIHNNIDPYYVGPGVLPGAFADQVATVWRNTPSPYGPLAMQISHFLDYLCGYQPFLSAIAARIPAVLGVILIGILVPKLADRLGTDPAFAAWFATLNPLLVIDFVGGAHNDSLMMGLVILGIWVACRRPRWAGEPNRGSGYMPGVGGYWWLLGAAITGLGATIKQPAFLAAYALPLIARPWRNFSLRETAITVVRVLTSFVVAIGVFVTVSLATGLGFGWLNAVSVPGKAVTMAPSTIVGEIVQFFLNLAGVDPSGHAAVTVAHSVFLVLGGVLIALLAVSVARRRPVSFVSYGYLSAAVCGPAMHSWYMLWSGLLFPHTRPNSKIMGVAVWTTVVLLSYDAVLMAWRNNAIAVSLAAIGGFWWLARAHQATIEVPPLPTRTAAHLELVERQPGPGSASVRACR